MIEDDYYKLLDIWVGASKAEIKRAYYTQVKIHSPEKAPERFKALRAAYEFLMDDNKRADYDKYAGMPKKEAGIAMEAKRLLYDSKYSEAIDLLKKKKKNSEMERLLAEAYLKNGNSGLAIKILEGLLNSKPNEYENYIQLAEAYHIRGFSNKSIEMIESAANKFPYTPEVWCSYIWLYNKQDYDLPIEIIQKIIPIADKIAAFDFTVFFICIEDAIIQARFDLVAPLFSHFADGFIAAQTLSEIQYDNTVEMTKDLITAKGCFETGRRLADYLEKHALRKERHNKALERTRDFIDLTDLGDNNILFPSLIGLTMLLLLKEIPQFELHKLKLEYDLINNIDSARESLKTLQNKYPRYFKLNSVFYMDMMNPSRYKRLKAQYEREFEKQKRLHPDFFEKLGVSIEDLNSFEQTSFDELPDNILSAFNSLSKREQKELMDIMERIALDPDAMGFDPDGDDDDYDDPFYEYPESFEQPYVRTERKVGRNEPCPCGSGKKHKQCCGRSGARAANQ